MGWASFHVIEVMSSPRFHLKSMGYLAAAQSFQQDTDVLMLVTNTLKKVRGLHLNIRTYSYQTLGSRLYAC